MSRDGHRSTTGASQAEGRYRAIVESYENRPDQCTIFPAEASGVERMSTWLTARGTAFVDLESAR